jgi:hypothetical protein
MILHAVFHLVLRKILSEKKVLLSSFYRAMLNGKQNFLIELGEGRRVYLLSLLPNYNLRMDDFLSKILQNEWFLHK